MRLTSTAVTTRLCHSYAHSAFYFRRTLPIAQFQFSTMALKRKAPQSGPQYADSTGSKANQRSADAAEASPKKAKTKATNGVDAPSDHKNPPFINRKYYPAEMSNDRCRQYNENEIPRPIELVETALEETLDDREKVKPGKAVLFWYKRDLRLFDNRGLGRAAAKAKEANIPLICLYIVSPEDYEAHCTSPMRVDFDLRTLEIMKKDLAELDIPLVVETVEKRKKVPQHIIDMCKKYDIKHVYCNLEYEVDELRREAKMVKQCLDQGIAFSAVHDDLVVTPGKLLTGAGKAYAVYSPWFRSWIKYVHANSDALEPTEKPGKNPSSAQKDLKDLFSVKIPSAPKNKSLSADERKRLAQIWPAGEKEAQARLKKFCQEKISGYADNRNKPAGNHTAMLSVHHSAGTLNPRTTVRAARDANNTKKLDGGKAGVMSWISEVAWRDFYKHVMVHWPYVCMAKPFKYEYTNVEWEYNDDHFEKWTEGQTGFPIVDAAMRQMKNMHYVHNRCRMIVASFLAKDLLLDWRLGEKFFMENLIDGDFASNNGGWGFSASTGVDPQPYFRIFNPLLQSEKFDPDGEYIRKWVPELKDVDGKAIHDPYGRGAGKVAEKNGYPKPIVNHKECRERALTRYKEGLGRTTA